MKKQIDLRPDELGANRRNAEKPARPETGGGDAASKFNELKQGWRDEVPAPAAATVCAYPRTRQITKRTQMQNDKRQLNQCVCEVFGIFAGKTNPKEPGFKVSEDTKSPVLNWG